jgi:iron complex outermembrane recepter protein
MHFKTDGRAHLTNPLPTHAVSGAVRKALQTLVVLGGIGAAYAQAPAPAPADEIAPEQGVEEIVVSATRRDTKIQDTPLSISAVSNEALVSSGVSSMQDIAILVPTMRMEGGRDGGARISMRGIRAPSGEATVGLYYNDVPMSGPSDTSQTSGSFTQEANLFDVERVEALRGPQGTLYGAGAMGGTIRVLFNKASTTETSGQVDTMVSTINHGGMSNWVKAAYNVPLIENVFGIRASVWKEHRGGYVDDGWVRRIPTMVNNPNVGAPADPYGYGPPYSLVPKGREDVNIADIRGGRVMLKFTPTEWLTWDGMAMYQKQESVGSTWDTYYPWNAERLDGSRYMTSNTATVPTPGQYTIYSPILAQQSDEFRLFSSNIKVATDFADFDLVTSYYDWTRAVSSNYSDTYSRTTGNATSCRQWKAGGYGAVVFTAPPAPGTVPACSSTEQTAYTNYVEELMNPSSLTKPNWVKSFINEFRVASNGDGPLDWLVGAYLEERTDHVDSTEGQVLNNTGLIDDLYAFPVYWWRFIDGKVKQTAMFADLTYKPSLDILPGLAINYGIRRFDYDKFTSGGVVLNGYGDGNLVGNPQFAGSGASAQGWLPKYNLSYEFVGPYMVYATMSKGFRPGGANVIPQGQLPAGASASQFLLYQPDAVWNYEIGGKTSWFNNTLVINTALYQVDWQNTQTSLRTPNNCCSYVGNAGAAQVQGLEADITYVPLQGLTATAGFSYNWKSELTENQSADGVAPTNTQGQAGDRLPYVAKLNASFNIDYKRPVGLEATALFRINYSYTGKSTTSLRPAFADPLANDIGGYSTVNVRFGAERDGWSAYLFVNNILDDDGIMNSTTNATYNQGTATTAAVVTRYFTRDRVSSMTPREIGLNVRKVF